MAAPEIQVVRLGVLRLASRQAIQAIRRESEPDLLRNGSAQFTLEGEQAAWFAIVGFGPNLNLITHANQLAGDAQSFPLSTERTLDQISCVEFPADFRDRLRCSLVGHHRRAANDTQMFGINLP